MLFLIFCSVFLIMNWITMSIYLFMIDITLLVVAKKYLRKENQEFLEKLLNVSRISLLAYVLVRIIRENICSWSLQGRSVIFYVLMGMALILHGIFMWKFHQYKKVQEQEPEEKEQDLLKSRKHDLKRLETYLEQVNIVGINGAWGTGKSFLVKKFCEENSDKYETVRVDLLTCNLDQVDVLLLQEMESILRKHGIYPKYSKKLCSMMKEYSWLKELRELLQLDNEVKSMVFDGFKQDMKKLHKSVVIIIEDLDRVSDETFVRKILDLTERLSSDWIKILIEYDAFNLKRIGFDREYLEKYIPYVVNLTEISLQSLMENFINKNQKEFHYLYYEVFIDESIRKYLGITGAFHWDWKQVSVRKVKIFLEEFSLNFQNLDSSDPRCRKTMATFLAMKHFLPEIYEQIPFRRDFIEEISFQCPWESKCYNLRELFALRRWEQGGKEGGLSIEQTRSMFIGNSKIVEENRQKLCILCSINYNFYVMDEEDQELQKIEESQGIFKGEKRLEHRYQMEMRRAEALNWNEKVSRLMSNLHANGRSELTNEEQNARNFIQNVLIEEPQKQEQAWRDFGKKTYLNDYEKEDNETIFRMGGNRAIELAQALYLFMQRNHQEEKEVFIWLEFIRFCYQHFMSKKRITPEYIRWCNAIKADKREVFLEIIRRFCDMKIVGNFNRDKEYLKFLKNYYRYGYGLGYFTDCDDWQFDLPEWNQQMIDYIKVFLKDKAETAEQEAESEKFGELIGKELNDIAAFLRKNIEIIDMVTEAEKAHIQVHTEERSRYHYRNEKIYHELEKQAENEPSREECLKKLQEAYKKGNISLADMRCLLKRYEFE